MCLPGRAVTAAGAGTCGRDRCKCLATAAQWAPACHWRAAVALPLGKQRQWRRLALRGPGLQRCGRHEIRPRWGRGCRRQRIRGGAGIQAPAAAFEGPARRGHVREAHVSTAVGRQRSTGMRCAQRFAPHAARGGMYTWRWSLVAPQASSNASSCTSLHAVSPSNAH